MDHTSPFLDQRNTTQYFNRKGWHPAGCCGWKGLFWNLFVGAVLCLSGLWGLVDLGLLLPDETKNICGHDVGYYILADAAYPLKSWLMKPFTDNGRLTPQQLVYNHKTGRARVVVENTFGRLKGRWRCLLKRNDCNIHKVKSMAIACCVLHNLCEMNGDEYREEWGATALNQPDGALSSTVEPRG
uniref:DDE Tnp4 domain-containing protein n=1 Tax=Anguilla anguilla TaxID=7936 RepID=A0A0E9WQU1_ANGAN